MTASAPEAALAKAKAALAVKAPFYGALAVTLPCRVVDRAEIGALAATDGETLYMSVELLCDHSHAEIVGVLVHEIEHVVRQHALRRGDRDAVTFNVAADYLINSALLGQGFTLPDGVLHDAAYHDAAYTTESLYERLQQEREKQGQGRSQGGDQNNNPLAADVRPGAAASADAQRARVAARVAAAVAAARGKVPGHLKDVVEAISQPRIDWRDALAAFMRAHVARGATETWRRLDRRMAAAGYRLPARQSLAAPRVGVLIDTSGSVAARASDFVAEVATLADECQPEAVHVVMCDTAVTWEGTFAQGEPVIINTVCGGGGTDLRVGFEALTDAGAAVIVCLTDCETPWPSVFSVPTLIVGVGPTAGPEGARYVRME